MAARIDTSFLDGGGELGARIRAYDWTTTPLGPPEDWPRSLKTAVRIMLTSRQPFWLGWGPELTYLYNDPYKSIIGGKHPDALGKPFAEVWHEIYDVVGPMAEQVVGEDEGIYREAQLLIMERHGYPEETYYTFSYSPVHDDSGRPTGLICANTDDTRRVIGERQLATLRELAARTVDARDATEACQASIEALELNPRDVTFALIVRSASEGRADHEVVATSRNLDERAVDALLALQRATDCDRLTPLDLVDDIDWPTGAWPRSARQAMCIALNAAGSTEPDAWLFLGLNPFRQLDESYHGFLELVAGQVEASISNAEAYARERARAEALAELDRAKTAFFSNVSHEFRTPLTLMLGPLDDLLGATDLPPAALAEIERVHRNGLRLLDLVNTLLDFSRLEAGRTEAAFEPTDLATLTGELAGVFRSTIESAGLQLELDMRRFDEVVYVDRGMWEKIVFNLLSNAFKFTFEGEIEVALRLDDEARDALLVVRDTGSGIPTAELPHLFERFHRVEGAAGRSIEGSGIGLALVHELVRLHGGRIDVESTLGEGSCFTVRLPLGHAHLPAEQVRASSEEGIEPQRIEAWLNALSSWLPDSAANDDLPPAARMLAEVPAAQAPADAARASILVVDDNADMRDYLRQLLGFAHDVEVVADGLEALDAIRARRPDLVVTDVMMPRLDGFGLIRALRDDDGLKSLPVIMLSARAGEEARVEGLSAGADDYLAKPFSARELLARVEARLELTRLRTRLDDERTALQRLFAQTPMPTAVLRGDDLVFELANPGYERISGHSDLVGKTLLEAMPELRGQGFDDLLRNVMATGEAFVGNELLVRLDRTGDGTVDDAWFTFIYAPLTNREGDVDGVIVLCSDVTDQVVARERIERSEQRYRSIFDSVGASVWEKDFTEVARWLRRMQAEHDLDSADALRAWLLETPGMIEAGASRFVVIDINDTSLEMFAAPDKRAMMERQAEILLPHARHAMLELLVAIADGRSLVEGECQMATFDDRILDVTIRITLARPADPDAPLTALSTVVDITDRKRAERALRAEALALDALYRVGRRLAAQLDVDRIYEAVVEASVSVVGADRGAIVLAPAGSDGWRVVASLDRTAPLAERHDELTVPPWLRDLVARQFSTRLRGSAETDDPSLLISPIVSRTGDHVGGLVLWRDEEDAFSERGERLVAGIASQASVALDNARLHEQRVQLIDELRESDRRKDEFLATLSHELRNPLSSLSNALHLLDGHEQSPARQQRVHDLMRRQVRHLVRLIDDLLELSRINRGQFELRIETLDLDEVIATAVETTRPLFEAAGQQLDVSLAPTRVFVEGDAVRLGQIVTNLLNNASKYSHRGGHITLTIQTPDDESVDIIVRDNGVGISARALPNLFAMFNRGDQATGRGPSGLGVGLALARQLARMHDGDLTAASEGLGKGSAFTLRLPRLTSIDAPRPETDPVTTAETESTASTQRILVVDDNHDAGETLALLLQTTGAEVKLAGSGPDALDIVRDWHPGIVLLDIGMPEMDGYEVARRIRSDANGASGPVLIAVTGWGQAEDRRQAREAGFDHHLVKPVDFDALLELIDTIET